MKLEEINCKIKNHKDGYIAINIPRGKNQWQSTHQNKTKKLL